MQVTVSQIADLINVRNTGRAIAMQALRSENPTAIDVGFARIALAGEREVRLNDEAIKADPLTETLFGGFGARWSAEVDLLNSAERLIDAVAQIVGAPLAAVGFSFDS